MAEGRTFPGWSLSMLRHVEEAVAECRKAIALDPDYGNPYNDIWACLIELGRVHLAEGNPDAARRSFEQALRHDPDYLPARKALDYLDAEFGKLL